MSDESEREAYSTVRAYECVECGARMRWRGIDGRCIACHEAPPVRCERCARVRFDPGGDWQDHPGRLLREVEGECATCGAWRKRVQAAKFASECRRTAARAAKGYGGPAPGEDVFRGFKEGQ